MKVFHFTPENDSTIFTVNRGKSLPLSALCRCNGGPAINTVRQMFGNEAAETLSRRFLFDTQE
ncbi:MAG: hypothetical protein IJQ89_10450 [Bacteroidales bacterium]|nr:hypothetical protein [Bacteroidales bacterium]